MKKTNKDLQINAQGKKKKKSKEKNPSQDQNNLYCEVGETNYQ